MALHVPPAQDKKRVKVYELRENDWHDRGTGFCTAQMVEDEPRICVESEDQPDRILLRTKITKDDGHQKQQDTLIVWTEKDGVDMALSFQEAEGCASIWQFVHQVQKQYFEMTGGDDALSDDMIDALPPLALPAAELRNLQDILDIIRHANATTNGREGLSKFLVQEGYLEKLVPLMTMAEDLESLEDLHRLCDIMKQLIILNDNSIIEVMIADENILGVVGALEYDSDFPTHKANHRQYLSDEHRFKEVVKIKDPQVRKKIKYTWRLQYLKDVVLARIIDDPTFSVLNSIIFFYQVDIVHHLQTNQSLLKELFAIFDPKNPDTRRKEDAVHFLHHCAAVSKTIQAQARATLFNHFIAHGLFGVISFAIKHPVPSMRTTGIDILVALLDHDPIMMRSCMLKSVVEKKPPLTDALIDLLHVETDLGVKNQLADAIKVLLDPQPAYQDGIGRELMGKVKQVGPSRDQLKHEQLAQDHFDGSCQRLFLPLKHLETRKNMSDLSFQEVSLHTHLVEILTFLIRQHPLRSRHFVVAEQLPSRVAQLLTVPQKALKLTALKFFRTCVALQDQFYANQMTQIGTFGLILDIVLETMPRDNLLNSACLEMFEFMKRENIKPMILHVVDHHRDKLERITYVDTFQNLIRRYEQMQGYNSEMDSSLFSHDEDSPTMARNNMNGGARWQGLKDMEPSEEEYFNTSDDEDDEQMTPDHSIPGEEDFVQSGRRNRVKDDMDEKADWMQSLGDMPNGMPGGSPLVKPLVDYPDDDEEESAVKTPSTDGEQILGPESMMPEKDVDPSKSTVSSTQRSLQPSPEISPSNAAPPERLSEKRRREEDDDDDDELGKLSASVKRRTSSASATSSVRSANSIRRKHSVMGMRGTAAGGKEDSTNHGQGNGKVRIAISLGSSKPSTPPDSGGDDEGGGDEKENTA
ncbi:MAG: hypothetical protein Q9227_006366 [Pyrenula ochraceoflavens]